MSGASGPTSRCIAPYARFCSAGTPSALSVRKSWARWDAYRSSVVLPIPCSPVRSMAPPQARRQASTAAVSCRRSACLPMMGGCSVPYVMTHAPGSTPQVENNDYSRQ